METESNFEADLSQIGCFSAYFNALEQHQLLKTSKALKICLCCKYKVSL